MRKIYNLQFTNYKFITLFLCTFYILYYIFSVPVLAIDATSSPTPVLSNSQLGTQSSDLKTKIEALKKEIASKAANLKQEVSKRLQNKAYIGFIKSKSDNSITIATKKGTKIININEFTQYSNQVKVTSKKMQPSGKLLSAKDLNLDDYIVALGDIDETSVLNAKKIIKAQAVEQEDRQIVLGQVTNFSESAIKINAKNNVDKTFSIIADTIFKAETSSAVGSLANTIPPGKPVVIVASKSKGEIMTARFIYILSYQISPKPKVSTPSAIPASSSGSKN